MITLYFNIIRRHNDFRHLLHVPSSVTLSGWCMSPLSPLSPGAPVAAAVLLSHCCSSSPCGFSLPFEVSEIRLKFQRPFEVWDSFEFQWFEVSVIRDVRALDCSDFFFAGRLQCSSPCEQDQLPGQSTAQGSPALEMRLVGTFQWCAQLSQAGVDRLHRRLLDEFHLVCFRASSGLQPSEPSASRVSVWPRRDVPCSSNEVLPRLTTDVPDEPGLVPRRPARDPHPLLAGSQHWSSRESQGLAKLPDPGLWVRWCTPDRLLRFGVYSPSLRLFSWAHLYAGFDSGVVKRQVFQVDQVRKTLEN